MSESDRSGLCSAQMNPGFCESLEKGIELFNRQEFYEDQQWDAGKGLAIAATGAAVVGTVSAVGAAASAPPPPAAASSEFTTAPATPPPAAPGPPCANATSVPAGGVTYTKCGSTWYTLAYGANGPAYVQSAPPPGS